MPEIQSICIVRLSALGDVLMLVPLIRTLQRHCPNAHLTWVISKPAFDLVAGLDGVEFIVIDKPQDILDYWRFRQAMKSRYFDVLLATQASFRANLLYACIRAGRKIGYDRLRAKDGHGFFVHETIAPGHDHTLDGFLRFADCLNITQKEIDWNLPISAEDQAFARSHIAVSDKPIVLVNPAASKAERSWLTSRYIDVIRALQARWQAQVILTGGPCAADLAFGEAISQAVPVLNLIGKTKPKQLLALMQLADVLLCPDTGPSHMATAVGTKVIALHAVTSAAVSGPYLSRDLCVDCYPTAVETILHTTVDKNTWGRHAHGSDTMRLITVDAVLAQFERILSGRH
jgi:heptosyltransferase I